MGIDQHLEDQRRAIADQKALLFDAIAQREQLDARIQAMRIQLSGLLHRADTLESMKKAETSKESEA